MNENEVVKEFRAIRPEYSYNPDIMSEENERVAKVKEIIDKRLSLADRTIFILYADCQSYRKLARKLGLSHMTIRSECMRIRNIILNEINKK